MKMELCFLNGVPTNSNMHIQPGDRRKHRRSSKQAKICNITLISASIKVVRNIVAINCLQATRIATHLTPSNVKARVVACPARRKS